MAEISPIRSARITPNSKLFSPLTGFKLGSSPAFCTATAMFGILLLGPLARPVLAEPQQQKAAPRVFQVKSRSAVVGLRLANINEKSGFGRAGFVSGDIIKSLNGKPVRSLSEMTDIISTSEAVTAVVLRNEQPIRFTFPGSLGLPNIGTENEGSK